MPILDINNDTITQRCAVCGRVHEHQAHGLGVGAEPEPPANVLALPACPCGAVEFLVRAPDDEPAHPAPGSFGHRHRILVDALVDAVREGQPKALVERVRARIDGAALEQLFAHGLTTTPDDPAAKAEPTTREEPHEP